MASPSTASPPLVLLHAFPFDHRIFDGLGVPDSHPLPGQTFAPDFRGFGEQPLIHHDGRVPHPSLDVLADDVIDLLDSYGIDRAVVGGVSLGGYVVMNLLARYPHRLAGLILADTKADADTDEARQVRLDAAAAADSGDVRPAAAVVAGLVAPGTAPDTAELLALYAGSQSPAAIAWAQRAMADRPDSFEVLAGCRVPVLVVVGSQDQVTGLDRAEAMADATPGSTLVVIDGAGHLAAAEAPAAFAAAVTEWWSASGL
ncbi:alpha/beta fold hydrolase [Nakamurella silvestris]|nr:alpha/beta fold hydrolase [Nakamurella silvestris]